MAADAVSSIVAKIANGVQFKSDDHGYEISSLKDGIVIEDENGQIIGGINEHDIFNDGSVEEPTESGDDTFANPTNAWVYEAADPDDDEGVGVLSIGEDGIAIENATIDANTKITIQRDDEDEIVSVTLDNVTLGSGATYDGNDIQNLNVASQTGAIVITFTDEGDPQIANYIDPTKPAWTYEDGVFSYESDTTNFKLQGAAFADESPMDNVPDGVSVVDGKLVFGGDYDTVDFHIAGTGLAEGDTIAVNGATFYLGDTDGDTVNGFELSATPLETPWSTIEGGFVYDSDGTTFTLTGAADADNDGTPDGVTYEDGIINGVPTNASVNGQAVGVTEGEDADGLVWIALDGNNIATVGGVDEGATISTGSYIDVADGVTNVNVEAGTHNIEGREFTVTNDADGVSVALSDGSITGIGGLAAGASITGTAADTAVSVDGATAEATTGIGQVAYTTADTNGYVVSNNTITGLDNRTLLKPSQVGAFNVNGASLNLSDSTDSIQGTANSARVYTTQMAMADSLKPSADYVDTDVSVNADGSVNTDNLRGRVAITLDSSLEPTDYNFSTVPAVMYVTMLDDDQNVTLPSSVSGSVGNVAEVDAEATGRKNIKGGDLTNRLINESTAAFVSRRGGAAADTMLAAGGYRETLDLQDGGEDVIYAPNGANIINYNPDEGAVLRVDDPTAGIFNDQVYLDANGMLQANGVAFSINGGNGNDDDGNLIVNLADDDETVKAAFTAADSTKLDRSSSSSGELLVGNGNPTLANKLGAEMIGGSVGDTLLAGSGDTVNGGGGADLILLASDRDASKFVTVQMSVGGGADTVIGFEGGFDENDDVLSVPELTDLTFTREGANIVAAIGAVRTTIVNAFGSDSLSALADEDDDTVSVTATNDTVNGVAEMRVEDRSSGTVYDYSLIENSTAVVAADAYLDTSRFVGLDDSTISAVNFTNYQSDDLVVIDLNSDTFKNINAVQASNGDASVLGGEGVTGELLIAGLGDSTINANTGGGAYLFGRGTSSLKTGSTTFVYGDGYGADTITGFTALTADNEDTADKLVLDGDADVTTVGGMLAFDSDTTGLTVNYDRNDSLVVANLYSSDASEAQLQINDGVYKAGTAMVYGENVDGYIGDGTGSIVAGENDSVDSVEMWLGLSAIGYNGKTYTGIKDVNVSGATSALVAGNELENVIVGSAGNNSLWGGAFDEADTLIGSTDGVTGFFYAKGNGSDEIYSYNDDDLTYLLDIGLDDIANITDEDNALTIEMQDGGSVKVNGDVDKTFQIKDGYQWTYKKDEKRWEYKGQA